jgi:hypothetical protein
MMIPVGDVVVLGVGLGLGLAVGAPVGEAVGEALGDAVGVGPLPLGVGVGVGVGAVGVGVALGVAVATGVGVAVEPDPAPGIGAMVVPAAPQPFTARNAIPRPVHKKHPRSEPSLLVAFDLSVLMLANRRAWRYRRKFLARGAR